MTEAELAAEVTAAATSMGLLWHRCADSRRCRGSRGFPDLVIAGPAGILLAELKNDHDVTSADQDLWAWMLAGSAIWAYRLWRPADWRSGRIRAELAGIGGVRDLPRPSGHPGTR